MAGKCPVFIDPKCDFEVAARRILWGKVINAGQTCVAPDYILVPTSHQDKLVQALTVALVIQYTSVTRVLILHPPDINPSIQNPRSHHPLAQPRN